MAGAGGFEPPPSALTVQRPANWTTPQRLNNPLYESNLCAQDSDLISLHKALTPGLLLGACENGIPCMGLQGGTPGQVARRESMSAPIPSDRVPRAA
jgi:hypothetical protein